MKLEIMKCLVILKDFDLPIPKNHFWTMFLNYRARSLDNCITESETKYLCKKIARNDARWKKGWVYEFKKIIESINPNDTTRKDIIDLFVFAVEMRAIIKYYRWKRDIPAYIDPKLTFGINILDYCLDKLVNTISSYSDSCRHKIHCWEKIEFLCKGNRLKKAGIKNQDRIKACVQLLNKVDNK